MINPGRGIWIVALALVLVAASVNLQVPLYAVYAERSGYGVGATSIAFAFYISALIPMLVLAGGLSDRIGRKLPLLGALACAFISTIALILVPRLEMVGIARIAQGFAISLTAGAGTAWAAELDLMASGARGDAHSGARAASLVTIMTALGFGAGACWTAIDLMIHGPSLDPFSYHGFAVLIAIAFLLILAVPETHRGGAHFSILRLPAFLPGTTISGLSIALGWSVVGIVIAILPAALAQTGLSAWVGVALLLINGGGGLTQIVTRHWSPTAQLRSGLIIVPTGLALIIAGVLGNQIILIIAGAILAGMGTHGTLYQGGLILATAKAGVQRARAASAFFIYAYLGLGLPAIPIGILNDLLGRDMALVIFGGFTLLASGALLFASLWSDPTKRTG